MSRTKRVCVVFTAICLLALISLRPTDVRAQRPRPPQAVLIDDGVGEEQNQDGLTIPKDREATAIITAAKEYVVKKDWDTVARSLQYLLEKPEDSFFEYKRKDEKGKEYTARISIRIEANRLIGELPPEGLETYRQKYGQKAMLMLQDGIDHNDPAVLSMVALRYRHTEAGVKAIHLLGNYFLDRGNYQLASGKFQELLELLEKEKPEVKKEIGPKTFFKAALAYQRFGDTEMAEKLWKQVAEQVGDKGLVFGKQTYTLQSLRAEFERNAQVGSKSLTSVPVLRGDPSRTAQGIGGVPILESKSTVSMFVPDPSKERRPDDLPWYRYFEWTQNTSFLKTAEWVQDKVRGASDALETASSKKRPLLPGFFPIAGENRIIFRTYDGIYAYYLHDDPAKQQKAGTLAWASESMGSLHALGKDGSGVRSTFDTWWAQYNGTNPNTGIGTAMQNILFENSTVGTLSHDNNLVYYVDDLALPPPPNMNMYANGWAMANAANYGVLTDPVLYNSLRAIEMDTGKVNWEIGGRKQGGKVPTLPNNGPRVMVNGRMVQIGPDGNPIEKKPEPEKPFVMPKEFPEPKGFVNAGDELLDTFFLGPPLPIGGKLYLLVEYNGEIQLCCLNPKNLGVCKVPRATWTGSAGSETNLPFLRTPELVWRQPLGTVNQRLFQDTLRRTQPCHLAYSDGILVCPTNSGAIIAVNLLTQSLAWAYSYRTSADVHQENQPMQGGMRFGGRVRFMGEGSVVNLAAERWYPTPPAIANGNVVFTAPDTNSLICLSLRDAQKRWEVKRQAGDLYMAGVYNNKVLIVGKESIRALKLSDGTPAWDRPQTIGMPSGQGVASDGKYYLPCKNGGVDKPEPQILEINIDTGAMHATKSRHKEVPGNLIFFDGEVISQSVTGVSVFPQLYVKLAEMNARLRKNPNDPAGLIDRGELNLDKGELVFAINDLKSALDFSPAPDLRAKARTKLYEALTEQLQNHFDQGEKNLDLYKDLCLNEVDSEERQKRQSGYLCVLGKGREAQGKLAEAFDAFSEFGRINEQRMIRPIDQPDTLCRADVWARTQIMNMAKKAAPEQRKPLEGRVASKWTEVKAANDIEKVRKFVQEFGSIFASGIEARLELARRLMSGSPQDDFTEAEKQLDIVREQHDNISLAAEATEAEARLMVKKGQLRDAVHFFKKLGTEFKDVKLGDGRTGADVYNELITDKRFLPYLDLNTRIWNVGPMRGAIVTGPPTRVTPIYFSLEPEGEVLPFFRQHRLVLDSQATAGSATSQIRLVDRVTNETKWSFSGLPANSFVNEEGIDYAYANRAAVARNTRFAHVSGHILMLTMQHMVYAWDLIDQKKLWDFNLLGKNVNPQVVDIHTDADGGIRLQYADGTKMRVGQVGVLQPTYACLPTREGLVALNPVNGMELWKHEASSSAQVFGDPDHVFLVDFNDEGHPTRTMVLRAADGVVVKAPDFARLFQPSRHVATIGRNLVLFEDERDQRTLRFYDALTGQDIWRRVFPSGSLLARSTDSSLAGVVRPDGSFVVLDVAANRVLAGIDAPNEEVDAAMVPFREFCARVGLPIEPADRIQREHLANVETIALLHDADSFYFALNKRDEANGHLVYPLVTAGLQPMRLNGPLYRFNKSGRLEWFIDDKVRNQFLVLENFDELPIIIMGTMTQRGNVANAELGAYQKVDGKQIEIEIDRNQHRLLNNGQFYAMHTDVDKGTIELARTDLRVVFGPNTGEPRKDKNRASSTASNKSNDAAPVNAPVVGNLRLVMPAQRVQVRVQVAPIQPVPVPAPAKPADKP